LRARDIFRRVRLGSHIALELAAGALFLGGAVAGGLAVVSAVLPRLSSEPAVAIAAPPAPESRGPVAARPELPPPSPGAAAAEGGEGAGADPAAALPRPSDLALAAIGGAVAPPAADPAGQATPSQLVAAAVADARSPEARVAARLTTVYAAPDAELLAPLRDSPVTGCKLNFGGTSLSLRLDFQSGGRAAFKPDQVHAQSQPRREVAAYRIDRLLGIGHVPPAAAIVVSMEQLLASIAPGVRAEVSARIRAEARPKRGQLRGSASWWIPEIKVAAIGKYPIDSTDGIVTWRRYLTLDAERTPEITAFVSQISDMVLFDFLIDNSDRWSGGNARTSVDGKVLYFMDNTLAFTRNHRAHSRTNTYLRRVKVFSRRLVEAVRAFTREDLVEALSSAEDGALAPLLSDAEIDAVMARRALAVTYIDELITEHGAERVLAFP
jgi:hypothetical protein